jgi:hypothetical protein
MQSGQIRLRHLVALQALRHNLTTPADPMSQGFKRLTNLRTIQELQVVWI